MKTLLRKKVQADRLGLTNSEVNTKSRLILNNLLTLAEFNDANTLMIYMDFRKEVQTSDIITYCLQHQKNIVVPVVGTDKKNLCLIEIKSLKEDMQMSSFGILEPIVVPDRIRTLKDIDLVLAPGVAFDLQGHRLGYGAGYYDKLLENRPAALKVYGLAFDLQVVDEVPHDKHDQLMDGIITESGIYKCTDPQ